MYRGYADCDSQTDSFGESNQDAPGGQPVTTGPAPPGDICASGSAPPLAPPPGARPVFTTPLANAPALCRLQGMAEDFETMVFRFEDAGAIPNNPTLPLVVYKRAIDLRGGDPASIIEALFTRHAWPAAWRWGVYDFPHYHSTAHEVLGVYRGSASVRFGHTTGATLVLEPGDAVVIPAGVGHQNLGSSRDFHVVGAYPDGQKPDLLRGAAGERPAADEAIASVPLPADDPVFGRIGPLFKHWSLHRT